MVKISRMSILTSQSDFVFCFVINTNYYFNANWFIQVFISVYEKIVFIYSVQCGSVGESGASWQVVTLHSSNVSAVSCGV